MAPNTPRILKDSGRRHVIILANPRAGPRNRRKALDDLVANLVSRGLQPALCWELEGLSDHLKKANGLIRCVVAAGGDGTLQEVINRAPGLPISILPLGNENLLARHFHLLCSGKELAETIVHGQVKKLEGRVMHLHFKDLNEYGDGYDVPWGAGKADVKGMLAELKRQGYKGYLSIEYEYGDLDHLTTNLPKCVEFFDKTTAEVAK